MFLETFCSLNNKILRLQPFMYFYLIKVYSVHVLKGYAKCWIGESKEFKYE